MKASQRSAAPQKAVRGIAPQARDGAIARDRASCAASWA